MLEAAFSDTSTHKTSKIGVFFQLEAVSTGSKHYKIVYGLTCFRIFGPGKTSFGKNDLKPNQAASAGRQPLAEIQTSE